MLKKSTFILGATPRCVVSQLGYCHKEFPGTSIAKQKHVKNVLTNITALSTATRPCPQKRYMNLPFDAEGISLILIFLFSLRKSRRLSVKNRRKAQSRRTRRGVQLPQVQSSALPLAARDAPTMLDFLLPALLGALEALGVDVRRRGVSYRHIDVSKRSARTQSESQQWQIHSKCTYIGLLCDRYINICVSILSVHMLICFLSIYPVISGLYWNQSNKNPKTNAHMKFVSIFGSYIFDLFDFLGREGAAPIFRLRRVLARPRLDPGGMACWFAPGFSLLSLRGGGPLRRPPTRASKAATARTARMRSGAGVFDSDEEGEAPPPVDVAATAAGSASACDALGAAARLVLP